MPVRKSSQHWIDLEPGWRIRVVTPIQKSGSYIVRSASSEGSPPEPPAQVRELSGGKLEIAVTASPDYLGYEISFYTVRSGHRGGVVTAFQSATATINGTSSPRAQPAQPLFQFPNWVQSICLLHPLWSTSLDHSAAILAGSDSRELHRLAALVEADPSACHSYRNSTCQWIPAGIAARPERRIVDNGIEQWLPVI